MREPHDLSLRPPALGRLTGTAALLAALAACAATPPPAPPAPPLDLAATLPALVDQCRAIGAEPRSSVDAASATVTCTRPDGVTETWTLSRAGR